jgi:hypothetical protein
LIVSLANTGEVLSLVNRSGNRPSHEGTADQLDLAILLCRQAGAYRDGYYLTENLDLFFRMAEVGRIVNLPEPLLKYCEHLAKVGRSRMVQQRPALLKTIEVAHRRRGLEYSPPPVDREVRPQPDAEVFRTWDWWALMSGNVAGARKHSVGCLVRTPLDLASWKLFLRDPRAACRDAGSLVGRSGSRMTPVMPRSNVGHLGTAGHGLDAGQSLDTGEDAC